MTPNIARIRLLLLVAIGVLLLAYFAVPRLALLDQPAAPAPDHAPEGDPS